MTVRSFPSHADAKSYGHQETFNEDVTDEAFVLATLRAMADHLMAKVRADDKTIRTVTVKLRYNDFTESTGDRSLEEPTDIETDLYSTIAVLVKKRGIDVSACVLLRSDLAMFTAASFARNWPLPRPLTLISRRRDWSRPSMPCVRDSATMR